MSNIKRILTLNCEEAARLLSVKQDASLAGIERLALRLHLLICRACNRYNHQLRSIRGYFHILSGGQDELFPELKLSERKRSEIKKSLVEKTDPEK